jgi:hypothetical protein
MDASDSIFGDVIYAYTRAQAIRDGVLADLTQFHSIQRMWKFHVACTSTVWEIIEHCGHVHDVACLLISSAAQEEARKKNIRDEMLFKVNLGARLHTFKLHFGPGDKGEPVLTFMLPGED